MSILILRPLATVYHFVQKQYCIFLEKFLPKKLIELKFKHYLGYNIDWSNPIDINEKINWLKLYSDTSMWSMLADKYAVREYISSKGYKNLLVPLIGKWDCVDDIDWKILPKKFVMKLNNGSGDILVCRDKQDLDIKKWERRFKSLFSTPFGYVMGEPHYDRIKPCIIAEELLDCRLQPINTSSLIDYKIWCFDGKPYCIWACFNRTADSVQVASYDLNWIKHPEHSVSTSRYILSDITLPRPKSLDAMIEAASKLSEGFPQVRIDFYEVDGYPYFGEMTFTSNAGYMEFYTKEYLTELGNQVVLPN